MTVLFWILPWFIKSTPCTFLATGFYLLWSECILLIIIFFLDMIFDFRYSCCHSCKTFGNYTAFMVFLFFLSSIFMSVDIIKLFKQECSTGIITDVHLFGIQFYVFFIIFKYGGFGGGVKSFLTKNSGKNMFFSCFL